MVDLIINKRDGKTLTTKEIAFIIQSYNENNIPDYQMSALLMAIFFEGMNERECADLTMNMVTSGDQLDLSNIHGVKVDKHSTGGVGDKTTLVLAPLVASLGIPVAKMSGRSLGHTGGTIDKLEAIPGFHVEISEAEFIDLVNTHQIAVTGQTGNMTPADKKLYSLRDVTGTVDSIPLIASSIMSKKIASGADAICLDVKVGTGAFMKTEADARQLAHTMVQIGEQVGRKTMAVISDMSQPLGYAVGNALEVKEAIDTLKGNGPADLLELSLVLGSQMVHLAGGAGSLDEARKLLEKNLANGKALAKFEEFIVAQGGDPRVVAHPEIMPQAAFQTELLAHKSGFISEIIADQIGVAAMMLGAGRLTKDSQIDLSVGIVLHKKVGEQVKEGETLLTIHSNQGEISAVEQKIWENLTISEKTEPIKLIKEMILD